MTVSGNTAPAAKIALIVASANEQVPTPRGLYIAASGTISVTNLDTTTANTIPVVAGTVLPLQPYKITAIAGGAVVYGFYD